MSPTPLPILRARAHLTRQIRAFFEARDFLEVDTPVAIERPAPEHAIDPVAVQFAAAPPHPAHRRYLQTSPELQMKQLVARGLPRIFQLAPVFRDGDHSAVHRPEFRLLEWYRAGADMQALQDDCEALLSALVAAAQAHLGDGATAKMRTQWQLLARTPYPRVSVREALKRYAGVDLKDVQTRADFAACLRQCGVHHADDDSWADLFFRLFVGHVEPALLRAHAGPFFLTHFPLQLAALAQRDPSCPLQAERFELYAGGLELANAFVELRCAHEQRARFEAERAERARAGKATWPLDEDYLAALAQLPPTAGIALGIERVLMVLLAASDIDAISFVPWRTPCP